MHEPREIGRAHIEIEGARVEHSREEEGDGEQEDDEHRRGCRLGEEAEKARAVGNAHLVRGGQQPEAQHGDAAEARARACDAFAALVHAGEAVWIEAEQRRAMRRHRATHLLVTMGAREASAALARAILATARQAAGAVGDGSARAAAIGLGGDRQFDRHKCAAAELRRSATALSRRLIAACTTDGAALACAMQGNTHEGRDELGGGRGAATVVVGLHGGFGSHSSGEHAVAPHATIDAHRDAPTAVDQIKRQ